MVTAILENNSFIKGVSESETKVWWLLFHPYTRFGVLMYVNTRQTEKLNEADA